MKKLIITPVFIALFFTHIYAQKYFPIDVISNFGKKIKAEGSSITFNDSTVIFITSLGGKVNTYNLIITSKDEDKKPPVYNCSGKIGENVSHQFKIIEKAHLVVWNSIKSDKTLVERFLYIKYD